MSKAGTLLVLWTVLLQVCPADASAMHTPQRRRAPSSSRNNPLDAILLPESIRATLLLYLARNLSKAEADTLESDLRQKPDEIDNRLKLIGYYSARNRTSLELVRLRAHVLWMVENRPEHPSTQEPSLRDITGDRDGNALIQALWYRNIETRGEELAVVKNAQKFFFGKDPALSERLLFQLADAEPDNPQWAGELMQLYRMVGVPGFPSDDAVERVTEAYRRVLERTRGTVAREMLAGEMAESAFRIGDFAGAAALARIHLQGSDRSAVQRANTILGRVAVRFGDMAGAGRHLMASAGPDASSHIYMFGPELTLAQELLEKNERGAVRQYLETCLPLWPRGEILLQRWIREIEGGGKPNFGNIGNL